MIFLDLEVSEGNRKGVMGEVKEILEKYGGVRADRVWNAIGKVSKGKLKRMISDFVKEMEGRMWEEWKEEVWEKEKWYLMVKKSKGKEEYVKMRKRERCLLASVRLGVTNALGDKGKGGGVCRLCGKKEETGVHWVAECSVFAERRASLVSRGGEDLEETWKMVMSIGQRELVSFLVWIDSVLFYKVGVRLVEVGDGVERNEEFLDDLNLRADIWGRVGTMML